MRGSALILLLGTMLACAEEPRDGAGSGADDAAAAPPDEALDTAPQPMPPRLPPDGSATRERPDVKTDTLWLEGMPEPLRVRLYRAPDAFTTYVPEDILVEQAGPRDARGVRFIAHFGGQRRDEAVLSISLFPEGTSEQEARATVRAVAVSRQLQERRAQAPDRFAWSLLEHDFMYDCEQVHGCQMGTVALAEHGGRFLQVLLEYPEDYTEGFVPRAEYILRQLRWLDTGAALGS